MSLNQDDLKKIIEAQTIKKLTDIASRLPPNKQGSFWYKKTEIVVGLKTYRVGGYVRLDPKTRKIEIKVDHFKI